MVKKKEKVEHHMLVIARQKTHRLGLFIVDDFMLGEIEERYINGNEISSRIFDDDFNKDHVLKRFYLDHWTTNGWVFDKYNIKTVLHITLSD